MKFRHEAHIRGIRQTLFKIHRPRELSKVEPLDKAEKLMHWPTALKYSFRGNVAAVFLGTFSQIVLRFL